MRILTLSGSLRSDSLNSQLLRSAAPLLPPEATLVRCDDVGALPLFDQDIEVEPLPGAVQRFQHAIADADAVLIATPEYNGSLSGVLKNALDWASRPGGDAVLAGVPVAVVGASPSRFGAAWAQADTRRIVDRIGGRVVPLELPVAHADRAFDADGNLRDSDLRDRYAELLAALHDLAAGALDLAALAERENAVAVAVAPSKAA